MNFPEQLSRAYDEQRLRIRCVGRFRVECADGGEIRIRTRKARALVAYLALSGGAASREQLAALLWSGRGEEQARASLRQTIFELRRTEASSLIDSDHEQVTLVTPAITDLSLIRGAAERGDFAELCDLLTASDDGLLSGLDGIDPEFDTWLRIQRAHEPTRVLTTALDAAELCLCERGPRAAQAIVTAIQRLDPTCEKAARLQLRIVHQLGDRAAFHRHYEELREHLRNDYSVEPSPETEQLFATLTSTGHGSTAPSGSPIPTLEAAPEEGAGLARYWRPSRLATAGIVGLLLLLAAMGAWRWWPSSQPTAADEPLIIAVLPFEQQPRDDGFLAAGLWEHTRAALSRNPSLRLLGLTTTAAIADQKLPPNQYRKRFGVTHLLEGTVRRSGDQVMVFVSVTRTSDGVAVWQDMFRGRMGEPFSLEDSFATMIEGKLRGRLAPHGGRKAEEIATTPEVYGLYSEARELIASRERENFRRAEALLRQAVKTDSNYAPAWSLLAAAIHFNGRVAIADSRARAEALAAVRHALSLAPNLAQAHATLALVQGDNSPAAERELRRAVALDPNYAEAWMWLGNSLNSQFRSREAIAAYERTVEIDPLFLTAVQNLAGTAIEMQDHATLDALLLRISRAGASPALIGSIRANQLYSRGDYSGAVKTLAHLGLDSRKHPPRVLWSNWFETLIALGYYEKLHSVTGCPDWYAPMLRGEALPPTTFEGRAVSAEEFWTSDLFSSPASRAMVNLGRSDELVRIYRDEFGDADDFISRAGRRGMLLELAPTLAVALRLGGSDEEASYILSAASNELEPALRRSSNRQAIGQLAAIRAAQGERAQALKLLEAALRQGWLPNGRQYALDLAQEPALRDLRGDRRFENVRRRILAHLDRERAELGPVNV
jgi:DNA-binding SARP family transcriptional activator/TolB-like protein/Tfp pilus assembly protein PilF